VRSQWGVPYRVRPGLAFEMLNRRDLWQDQRHARFWRLLARVRAGTFECDVLRTSSGVAPAYEWNARAPHRERTQGVLRIGHISDLHVVSPRGLEWQRVLFNKRMTGYANLVWQRGRVSRRQ